MKNMKTQARRITSYIIYEKVIDGQIRGGRIDGNN